MTGAARSPRRRPPPWRDIRVISAVGQVLALVVVVGAVWLLVSALLDTMAARGLDLDLSFLSRTAGFEIGEHLIPYAATDSYGRALLVGLLNTVLISVLGIILATLLGLGVGLARMSRNFLLNRLAAGYIELFRNTPLLVQLFLLYFAVFLQLPRVRDSVVIGDIAFLNQRGFYLPAARPLESFAAWAIVSLIGIGAAIVVWRIAARRAADGRRSRILLGLSLLLLTSPALAWAIGGTPVRFEVPIAGRFNIEGGLAIRAEFMALLVGLVLYTAAFIAEVVRGGIAAVPRGQIEAARAIGLPEWFVLRLVVLPQAMRVIVPPLTSQYLNLAKNSSLAIVIGYSDLFNVAATSANQTGAPVTVLLLVIGAYLVMSLLTSLVMNVYNRRIQLRER